MTLLLVALAIVVVFAAGWSIGRSKPSHHNELSGDDVAHGVSLGDVLERHPTGIVIGDDQGHIEYRNEAARRLAGTHAGVLIDEAIERHLTLGRAGTISDRAIELFGPPKMTFVIS